VHTDSYAYRMTKSRLPLLVWTALIGLQFVVGAVALAILLNDAGMTCGRPTPPEETLIQMIVFTVLWLPAPIVATVLAIRSLRSRQPRLLPVIALALAALALALFALMLPNMIEAAGVAIEEIVEQWDAGGCGPHVA